MVFDVCQLELLFSLFLEYEDIREGFMKNGSKNRKSVCTIGLAVPLLKMLYFCQRSEKKQQTTTPGA